jgi:hypothetical protein
VSTEIYEGHGVRFVYPSDWVLEVTEDGPVTNVDLQHPEGIAFLLVRTDLSCPDPTEVADLVLEAMQEEYPGLEASTVEDTIDQHSATGHDVEFVALDIPNAAAIRCFRTPRRTVLVFGQWSELGQENLSESVGDVLSSIEETED